MTVKKNISILYVEDETLVQKGYARTLARHANKLYLASNGQEGFDLYLEHEPDIIITDIRMPLLNGIEMAKKIKEHNANAHIIFTSAHGENEYLHEAIELQVDAYLLKPVSKKALIHKIEQLTKAIYFDKLQHEQQKQVKEQHTILQNILNAEANLCIVTDFQNLYFVNDAFLKFLQLNDISHFFENYKEVLAMFADGFLQNTSPRNNPDLGAHIFELFHTTPETKRTVRFHTSHIQHQTFYTNIALLEEQKALYLLTFTDITQMAQYQSLTERKAYIDGLTQVYNRNKFEEVFHAELERSKRYNTPLSMAILDIDDFKKFNDTYGHLIGDEVLIMLAQTLNKHVRKSDLFARWGGEEFIILFAQTNIDSAQLVCESLRQQIQALQHPCTPSITASFGLSQLNQGDTLESLFKRCDDALYLSKKNGKNCVHALN